MAIDVDAVLLDRVFQPCADRLAAVASCFGLARSALVVACETQALTLVWDAVRDPSALNLLLSVLIGLLTVFGAQQAWRLIARIERQSRSGGMNVRRITLRAQRLTWLGVCGLCTALMSQTPDVRAASGSIACLAWIAVIYFLSCTPKPPAVRRSTRLSAAFS